MLQFWFSRWKAVFKTRTWAILNCALEPLKKDGHKLLDCCSSFDSGHEEPSFSGIPDMKRRCWNAAQVYHCDEGMAQGCWKLMPSKIHSSRWWTCAAFQHLRFIPGTLEVLGSPYPLPNELQKWMDFTFYCENRRHLKLTGFEHSPKSSQIWSSAELDWRNVNSKT